MTKRRLSVSSAAFVVVLFILAPRVEALILTKDLGPGQSSVPPPGSPVIFDIVMRNNTTVAVTGWILNDVLDPCFERLTNCSQVVCIGGVDCGTCTITGGNFDINGLALAPQGQPGDVITYRVTAVAGPLAGRCVNTALTIDPQFGNEVSDDAFVTITAASSVSLRKDLAPAQNPNPPFGAPVVFDITVRNLTGAPLAGLSLSDAVPACLQAITSCAQVVCSGGTACGTCGIIPGGFDVSGFAIAATGQPGDTITFRVSTVAGSIPGLCTNTASMIDPGSGGDLSDDATVTIGGAGLDLTKVLDVGQDPNPPTGSPVAFVINVKNFTAGALAGLTLSDVLDPCFASITSCAQVTCTGPGCGTCSLTATGFDINNFSLAPLGQPGDTVSYRVATVAGSVPGICRNNVSMIDPTSGGDLSAEATVTIIPGAVTLTKELDFGQNPTPSPGEAVVFVITISNFAATPVVGGVLGDVLDSCFAPILSCTQVVCAGGTSCGTCTTSATGFDINGYGLGPQGQPTAQITYRVSTTAGSQPGVCKNTASTVDPGGNDLSDDASVTILPAGVIIRKDLQVGQNPTPAPTDPVEFVITVTNTGLAPLTGQVLTDLLPACFVSLLSCTQVVCSGGTSCGTCAVTASGFTVTGYALAAQGSAGDSITFTVTTTASSTPGLCTNTATTKDPIGGGDLSDTASVTIKSTAVLCPLLFDDVTLWPTTPPKTGPWVYTKACSTGGPALLSKTLVTPVAEADIDALGGAGGTFRLYQVDCGSTCAAKIGLTKNRTTGQVALAYLP